MKYSLIVYASLFLLNTSCAMELVRATIDEKPTYDETENLYTLRALINEQEIGQVFYRIHADSLEIRWLEVVSQFRNKKIGLQLFKATLNETKKNKKNIMKWEAMQIDDAMPLHQIVEVYKKMAARLNQAEHELIIESPSKSGHKIPMHLKLK